MNTNNQNNQDNQEIDLSQISKKIGDFFDGISTAIFKSILFFKNNLKFIVPLFIIGAALGYFLDATSKNYDHQVIVTPNFGSTDYLYNKVDLLESKIKENDTVFLKSIGIENPSKISLIEIKPIIDIYSFVNDKTNTVNNAQNTQNFELVKLLSDNGDINKVIKDKVTSKNYYHHTLHIVSNGFISNKNTIIPILNYLNSNEYFQEIQKAYVENVTIKMKENEGIINQINGVLNEFSTTTNSTPKSDKLVYYNDNTQLNEVIKTKNALVAEIGLQKLDLINLNKIIKENSSIINIKNTKNINNKLKFILPILLIFGFIFLKRFQSFYKKQLLKQESK